MNSIKKRYSSLRKLIKDLQKPDRNDSENQWQQMKLCSYKGLLNSQKYTRVWDF